MPGTSRKTAPRKAAAKKAAPRPAPVDEPAGETPEAFDLLSILGTENPQPPQPVKLFGVEADIRRNFTGEEDLEFTAMLKQGRVADALKLLAGDEDGQALANQIAKLNYEQGAKVVNYLAKLSTLYVGEVLALRPPS